jgi:tRNA A-37 threonylcarbamoyl transferase component Bud32
LSAHQYNDPLVGRVIDDRYEVLARIGEGGMGVVYQARQTSIDRMVAIKMLNQQMAQDPNWVQRFYNEAKACSQLQHPNTIRMFEFGQTRDGRLFMAMEFLDGPSLRDVMDQGPMQPARMLKILIQACASLAEAHAIGIIHRDIKPDNVFLLNMPGSPDFVKVLDFSVAKLLQDNQGMKTQAGVVFGTPQYMSPEQSRGLPLDARSDLYALGILGYEMVTGRVPFNHDNAMMVLQMHLRDPIPPLPAHLPPAVQQIITTALDKDPNRRHQSAGEMMQACQQVFAQLGDGNVAAHMGAPRPQMGGAAAMGAQMGGAAAMGAHNMGGGGPPMALDAEAKTVVAGAPIDVQALIAQQQQSAEVQQYMRQQSGSGAKTLIASEGGPQNFGGGGMPGGGPQNFGGGGGGMPGGPQNFGGGPGFGSPADDDGPPKTMMLQDTEGIVSLAQQLQQGAPVQQQQPNMGHMGTGPTPQPGAQAPQQAAQIIEDGASVIFWVISLTVGVVVGVGAYVILRMVM